MFLTPENQSREPEELKKARIEELAERCGNHAMRSPRLAINYGMEALPLLDGIDFPWGTYRVNNNLSVAYSTLSDYGSAFEHLEFALLSAQRLGENRCQASVLCNMGLLYAKTGDYDLALTYLNNAENLGIDDLRPFIYNNFSELYFYADDLIRCRTYLERALAAAEELDNTEILIITCINVASLFIKKDNIEYALTLFNRANEKAHTSPDYDYYIHRIKLHLGDIEYSQGNRDAALNYYESAQRAIIANQYEDLIYLADFKLGHYYLLENEVHRSLEYYTKAYHFAKQHSLDLEIQDTLKQLCVCYERMGFFQTAYQYLNELVTLQQEHSHDTLRRRVSKIRLHQERERQNLIEKNRLIEYQKQQLESSNLELAQYAYIVSHDLKEPLRGISSFANLLQKKYATVLGEEGKEYTEFISQNAQFMNHLLGDLLDYSTLDKKELPLTRVDLNEIMSEVKQQFHSYIASSQLIININNTLPTITAYRYHCRLLFQNIISNAYKFRRSLPATVNVGVKVNSAEDIVLYFQDDGIGIEKDYHEKVFFVFSRLHKYEYPGTGIGLAMCQKITTLIGGRIWLESELGQGTTFYISLPPSAIKAF